jgi:replication initiation protein RepC
LPVWDSYEALAVPIRTYLDLEGLRELLARTRALLEWLSEKVSPSDDENVVHYHSSTQTPEKSVGAANGFQESVAASSEPTVGHRGEGREFGTGLQHLTAKQVLNAASERFLAQVPMHPRPINWSDLVEAAYRLKPDLRISQTNWGEACHTLGRHGAAVCLLLTDQAMLRPDDPVRQPGAYVRAMVSRARTGELNLQGSVFGLLKREEGTAADAGQTRRLPPGEGA